MNDWYHSSDHIELNSPSRADGVDFDTEARYRKEGARFIMELGNKLGLPFPTIASGWVFFHRFYLFHSFKEFPRWVTGATCLLLAGKVEETPKKCKNILKYAQQVLDDNKFKTFGENPREELMVCERVLLQTIKFDLQISHPYQYLIKYGKSLKGDKAKINDLIQAAWTLINESFLSTTLCLVYRPQVIAIAVLLLAIKETKQSIQDFISSRKHHEWWKLFYNETSEGELEQVVRDLTSMVIEGKNPKKSHGDKKKASEMATNSPQSLGSPKQKKMKVSTPSDLAADHSKLVNGAIKEEIDLELSAIESKRLPLATPDRGRRMSSRDSLHKQGSQTPEEMDVERPSPDLIGDIMEPKGHGSKDGSHHDKSKDHHQPVTLQQVQAAANKQLQKQVQKQRLLLHRKHHTPNKQLNTSSLQKMPTLTPLGTKDHGATPDLPELKSIATIRKQLDALSQEAEKVQQKTLALAYANSKTSKSSKSQDHAQKLKQKSKPVDASGETQDQSAAPKQQQHEQQPALHSQLSQQNSQDSPSYALHQQAINVQQHAAVAAINSPGTIDQSTHSSTPPNLADTSSAGAPLLDHMSSFFQSSQPTTQTYSTERSSYNSSYQQSQNYNNYQQQQTQPHTTAAYPQAAPLFPPQPPLPQGLPQPPPPQQTYSQPNYMNNGQQQQHQQVYSDTSSHTYSTYTTTQPQLVLPPPPAMFHGNHGTQSW